MVVTENPADGDDDMEVHDEEEGRWRKEQRSL